jgi:uncharacterized protein (TIGR02231 family)
MITTEIKEVSLYRNGAYITRQGSVDLRKGKETITVEGLSGSLDPSTLTVSLSTKVRGSNVRPYRRTVEEQNEIKKALLDELKRVQDKITVYSDQIEILKKNTDFTSKENISLKDMSEYIDALPGKISEVNETIHGLQEEEKRIRKALEDKNRECQAYLVDVDLECETDGTYPIALRYYENNASWTPFYEIRTGEEEKAAIYLKASLRQDTAADWKQIRLKLFTGDPSISADIPVLSPQHLSFYQPMLYGSAPAFRTMNASAKMSMAMEDTAEMAMEEADEEMVEVRYDQAEASLNDTMMEYDLNGLYDLEHESQISIDLVSHEVDCRYHIIAVPKADSFGYLAAEVKTADIEEVINSSANIYHKDSFLGNIYLAVDPNKENYDISLGKDETIRLKRQQIRKYRSNVLLKGQTKTEFVYELEISSLKDKEADITLIDQVPVSDDKTISVDIREISGAKHDENNGELKWEFKLRPNEKKTFRIAYDVSWPKDKKINI